MDVLESPLLLAYLGDAVMEVLVRSRVMKESKNSAEANHLALAYVTAEKQSLAVKQGLEHLTEEEKSIFTRAKNAKANSAPRNIDVYSYRLATGLEAVFGYNHLLGRGKRNEELFDLLFPHGDINKR